MPFKGVLSAEGQVIWAIYLEFDGNVRLANYTTPKTCYSSTIAGISSMDMSGLQDFLDKWI